MITKSLSALAAIFSSLVLAATSAGAQGDPDAALRVVGEVRTVDEGHSPRLWGRGRPGVFVHPAGEEGLFYCEAPFGGKMALSDAEAPWAAAADVCPAGTWVCTVEDVTVPSQVTCDTSRPDSSADARSCDGGDINFQANGHRGWLADHWEGGSGLANSETADGLWIYGSCATLPAWCCWETPEE